MPMQKSLTGNQMKVENWVFAVDTGYTGSGGRSLVVVLWHA